MSYDTIQQYYGQTLKGSQDLATNACCTPEDVPEYLRPYLSLVHPEVASHYYGCGLVAPELLDGTHVLDLGSGSGQDCFVLAGLVGERGRVVGVDMTEEQLAIANRHVEYHREALGHRETNVRFLKGYIERLDELGLEDASFDVIVSNCVINLSPDKAAVLREAHRLLKPGGELYFSDVYADRRVPAELLADPVLRGECLAGALYWNDFVHLAKGTGFADPRLVTDRPLRVENRRIAAQLGPVRFWSATYRLFRLDTLEPACEDYGQAVLYRGTIPHEPHAFALDAHHLFPKGKAVPVCGNTWRMLAETRFAPHFDFVGDFGVHHGIFAGCGATLPFDANEGAPPVPATAPAPATKSSGGCC